MQRVLAIFFVAVFAAHAQTISGTITGSVTDPSGSAIVGAKVTLIGERTGETRDGFSGPDGGFVFPALSAGAYTVKVEQSGFRPMQKTGNILPAAERLSVGKFELQVGSLTETVTVSAEGARVQTTSAERSALVTSKQLDMVSIRGRDVISLLKILPGVALTGGDQEFLGGNFGTSTPNIQGQRAQWNTQMVDGNNGNDLGSPNTVASTVNLDGIGEVKVMLNNYQAEYGRNGGASINIVTKSGGREYHGTAYGYKRHDSWNANNFFNNTNSLPRPIYRHNTVGFNLGGPAFVPKLLPRGQQKVFFFYSYERSGVRDAQPVRQVTTPSQLERAGDFSQSLDVSNRVIPITDPDTRAQFPGNKIPLNRINQNGLAMLNLFPLPNTLDRNLTKGNYNYQIQESINRPRNQHLFKIDVKPTSKDTFSVRGSTWYSDSLGWAVSAGSSNWGLVQQHYTFTDNGIVLNHTRVISPTVVNEFVAGVRHSVEKGPPASDEELAKMQRGPRGLGALGQFYPANNGLNIIPQASFGGVTGAAAITYDGRFPLRGADTSIDISDNVTWTKGAHTLKAGYSFERLRNYEGAQGTYGGNFNFGRDANNPFDSNYAYSNALLGNFTSYTEASSRPSNEGRKTTAGGFIQDTWRLTHRLTLDVGVRFPWFSQWLQANQRSAAFALERYDPSKAPVLYRPINSGGRRAVNPLTGEVLPAVLIGAFVPNTGLPSNGSVTSADTSYPQSFIDHQMVWPEPRIGLAYDVFGNGKTAIRASVGTFHNTVTPGVRAFTQNPPIQFNPIAYYGNLSTFASGGGVLSPSNIASFDRHNKVPSIYSYTLGVQQDIGFNTVLDVAYVGSVSRHLSQSRNLNLVPYGARFLPQNADPVTPTTPLNDNFFRPFPGWGNITYNENAGTANYNALQVSANRRFARTVQFGVAYTWSKTMDYVDNEGDGVARFRPVRVWNYGKAGFDQTHIFFFNYTWDLPRGSRFMPNPVTRFILDNWQASGGTALASGMPSGIGFSTVDTVDLSGGDGTRVTVTGKAQRDHGNRTFASWFDPAVFARTPRGDPGNSPKDVFRRPGFANWDMSFFKKFPLASEKRYFQFRWEMYNIFNHTQFQDVDTAPRFDVSGAQVNARFGQIIAARGARVMQGSLRFTF